MPTARAILADLKSRGKENTRAIYANHGIPIDRTWGVSNADLKLIAKTIKGQQALAAELYHSGNFDAMYLAGIVASGKQLTAAELTAWANEATGICTLLEYPIAWLALETSNPRELALQWIASGQENLASAGWATYSGLLATQPDSALDLDEIKSLLTTILSEIHSAPNRVRSTMNAFVIDLGVYVLPLLTEAKAAAKAIGPVSIDVGNTACKVRLASEAIAKAESAGKLGKKRKTIRC